MSDSKSSYGEPVEEPTPVDDVVGSANEGSPTPRPPVAMQSATSPRLSPQPTPQPSRRTPQTEPAPTRASSVDFDSRACTKRTPTTRRAASRRAAPPRPSSSAPAVTASEPVAETVRRARRRRRRAPTPHRSRSSSRRPRRRARAATAPPPARSASSPHSSSRVLYLAVWLGFGAARRRRHRRTRSVDARSTALGTWSLWVPVVVFFIAFWLLGAIINRGRWGAWVIFGLLVGFAAYARPHPRCALPGAVLDAHRERGRRSSSRASCSPRSRSRRSSSAAS